LGRWHWHAVCFCASSQAQVVRTSIHNDSLNTTTTTQRNNNSAVVTVSYE